MRVIATALMVWGILCPTALAVGDLPASAGPQEGQKAAQGGAAFVAYYWRARPDKVAEYNDYILHTAEAVDEDARRAGVFEEVRTVTPSQAPDMPAPDWTHLRIFRLKNLAAVAGLGPGLDAATLRVVPDEAQRKANSARSAGLRDLVRREVWTELR